MVEATSSFSLPSIHLEVGPEIGLVFAEIADVIAAIDREILVFVVSHSVKRHVLMQDFDVVIAEQVADAAVEQLRRLVAAVAR